MGGVAVVERPQCRDSGQSRIVFSLGGPHLSEVLGASRLDVEAFEVFFANHKLLAASITVHERE